jgi:hypothetical protein
VEARQNLRRKHNRAKNWGKYGGQGRFASQGHVALGHPRGSPDGILYSTSRLALIALLSAGASSLAVPAFARDFPVGTASDLANAINNAANGDTITFTSNITITLGSNLPAVTKNVTIEGNGATLSGQNSFRGFIIGDPFNTSIKPTVAINSLNIR